MAGAGEMGFDLWMLRVDPPVYGQILAVRAERQRLVTDRSGVGRPVDEGAGGGRRDFRWNGTRAGTDWGSRKPTPSGPMFKVAMRREGQ